MTEEQLLDDIFDSKWVALSGNKYKISFCELCDTFSISHSKCHGSTCNAGGCDECKEDFDEFNEYKTHIWEYLTEDEIKIYDKCLRIKKFIKESILLGQKQIDFKELNKLGKFSENDREVFKKELE